MKVLLCEPNISEGTDLHVVEQVLSEIRQVKEVRILHVSADADHNRTVFTYLGPPEAVLRATKAMATKAFALINMARHKGSHPRLGAVDVVPFVPVRGIDITEAVELSVALRYDEDTRENTTETPQEFIPAPLQGVAFPGQVRKETWDELQPKVTLRWKPDDDTFEFPGNKNSYVLEEKLAHKRNLPESRKREIYRELDKRARILERLHKKGGISGFHQLFKVVTEARKQGLI